MHNFSILVLWVQLYKDYKHDVHELYKDYKHDVNRQINKYVAYYICISYRMYISWQIWVYWAVSREADKQGGIC